MKFVRNDLKVAGRPVPNEEIDPKDLQGNILRGFRSLRAIYAFVRFPEDPAKAKAWIHEHLLTQRAPFRITNVATQGSADRPHVNFFLTATGLERLGAERSDLASMDEAFLRGARSEMTRRLLDDPPATDWAPDYRRGWDAMLLVAFNPADKAIVGEVERAVGQLPDRRLELGNVLDEHGRPLAAAEAARSPHRFEPFGYRDNISVTVFTAEQAEEDGIPNKPAWDPRRPLSAILCKDPFGAGFGSYFVYRKLKQDVAGFRRRVQTIADTLKERGTYLNQLYASKGENGAYAIFAPGKHPTDQDIIQFVKGRIMGRLPSGELPSGDAPENYAFNFESDRAGSTCPYSAHIRKMNPRGQTGDPQTEGRITIARRGIAYGRSDLGHEDPETGILFLCAQARIGEQFEQLQRRMANDSAPELRLEPTPMPDQVAGHPTEVTDWGTMNRYQRFTTTIEADFSIWDLVSLQGGEYLFAPSLSGLAALTKGGAR
jgi:deferrochelatase/peroxidase EfeB